MFDSNLILDFRAALEKEMGRQFNDMCKIHLSQMFVKHGIRAPKFDNLDWLLDTEYSVSGVLNEVTTIADVCPRYIYSIELWKKSERVGGCYFKFKIAGNSVIELED